MPYTPTPDRCIMFLVRHAATDNNQARPPRIQGRSHDVALSDEGRWQAQQTARFLADQPISAVYSSPLVRAIETAQIVALPHSLTPVSIDELCEVDVGRWEGKTWTDIERDEPERYRKYITNPAVYGYAGGENLAQVQTRVLPAIEKLMQSELGAVIAVVGHNVVNRTFLAALLNVPLEKARNIDQDNAGVNVIRYRKGEMKALTTNVAFHLQK